MMELIDPTSELEPIERGYAPRLETVEGQIVALLDISKPRGDVFLDRLQELLAERGATIRRFAKPTHAKPAPLDLRALIAEECAAVVEALAD
jgi:hypothetical protein